MDKDIYKQDNIIEALTILKVDQKYMKEAIERIERVLNKYIETNDERIHKIASEVANETLSAYKQEIAEEQFRERKFSWQKFTWSAAFLVSILMNLLTAYSQIWK